MTTQNLWDAAKAVLRGKLITIHSRKTSKRQPNITPKITGKRRTKKKKNPKISRRKEIIKIRAEINEKEMKETMVKINKTKSWFFEKINKIDKPLARLIKKKREESNQQKLEMKNERLQQTM